MFNPEQKKEYISFLISANTDADDLDFVEGLFNSSEKAETASGADISVMTSEQVRSIMGRKRNELDADHFRSIWWFYSYVKWCAASGLCGLGEWTDAVRNSADLENVRIQMVSNDLDLQIRLDRILTDEKKMTLDNLLRACVWLLFAGVELDKVCRIKVEDVDTKSMTVRVDDMWYDISEYGAHSIKFAAEEDSYVRHYLHAELTRGWKVDEDRVLRKNPGTDMLFRDSAGPIDLERMQYIYNKRVGSRFDKGGKQSKYMTLRTISMSGIFDRMYRMEMGGHDPLAGVFIEQYERLTKKEEGRLNPDYNGRMRKLSGRILLRENYYKWKLAFLPQINV